MQLVALMCDGAVVCFTVTFIAFYQIEIRG